MPRLTIIIPLEGDRRSFEDTLVSVLENRPSACEVLVVHDGSYDDPYHLSDEVVLLEQPGASSRVELLNAGIAASSAEVIHILSCGTTVSDGWTDKVLSQFRDPDVGCVSPLVVLRSDTRRIVSLGVSYAPGGTRRLVGEGQKHPIQKRNVLGPTLTAGFYRKRALREIGGFEESVGDALSDVDAALSLTALGYHCHQLEDCVVTAEETAPEHGSFCKGRQLQRLFWRHAAQLGMARSLLAHATSVVLSALGDIPHPGAITQVLGRLAACLEIGEYRRYFQAMSQVEVEEPASIPMTSAHHSQTIEPTSRRRAA